MRDHPNAVAVLAPRSSSAIGAAEAVLDSTDGKGT